MAVRAPHLHLTLRAFCLGAFVFLGRALEEGDDLPFAFEEHVARGRPALYEYRPLVRPSSSRARARSRSARTRAIALDELLREPAAAIFARAHAGPKPTEEEALFRTVLLPLLISTAEACGGFDWDDGAFERAYAELERSLFGGARAYAAVAPLVGISVVTQVELGGGIRVRAAATGELAAHWPEAQGLLPAGLRPRASTGYCVLELERALDARRAEPPDAPAELADAVTAIRLATAAPGRRRAGAVRAARLASVRDPAGAADRGDAAAGRADAARLLPRRARARRCSRGSRSPTRTRRSPRRSTAGSSRSSRTSRSAPSSCAGARRPARRTTLGAPRRCAARRRRARSAARSTPALRSLAAGEQASERAEAAVRRSLVETLRHGDRPTLVRSLDDALLGLRAAAGCVGVRRSTLS